MSDEQFIAISGLMLACIFVLWQNQNRPGA